MMEEIIKAMWNIGISLVEVFLLYYFFRKFNRKRTKYIEVFIYIIIASFDILLNYFKINSNDKLLILVILIILSLKSLYNISTKNLISMTVIFMLFLVLSEFCTFSLLELIDRVSNIKSFENNFLLNIEAVLIAKSINLLLVILTEKMLGNFNKEMKIFEIVITILPCLTNIFMMFFIVDYTKFFSSEHKGEFKDFITIFVTMILFLSSLSLLIIFEKYLLSREYKNKAELMEWQTKSLIKYYKEKEIIDDQVKRMYHDIKNHIICLENICLGRKECENYIYSIKQKINGFENYIETGNKILNVLLNQKIVKIKSLNIHFSCNINLKSIDFLEDIDVITIFSNAIDNAIEACEKIPVEMRFIKVNSAVISGFLVIKITNRIVNSLLFKESVLQTSKSDHFLHGIGIQNIKNSVGKYDGEVKIEFENSEFKLLIFVPLIENDFSTNHKENLDVSISSS